MSELLTGLTGHVLQSPGFLWLWLLIPIAAWWRLRRSRPSLLFGSGRFLASDSPSGRQPRSLRQRLLVLPTLLRAAGLFFGLLALARPVSLVREPDTAEGIEIVLCLDVSSSMTATDLDGRRSRLALAKAAAISFVRGREHDRIGLVTFARFPDLRSPLTRDREALIELLADVNTVEADGPEDATGIGTAVTRAAQLLGRTEGASRVVILLTDGDENVATAQTPDEIAPLHAAQLCAGLGIRNYVIMAGLGGLDVQGRPARLDTQQVRLLAEGTGGSFFEARDARAIASVYERIDALEATKLDEPRFLTIERFLKYLALGALLIVAARLLGRTWLRVLP